MTDLSADQLLGEVQVHLDLEKLERNGQCKRHQNQGP